MDDLVSEITPRGRGIVYDAFIELYCMNSFFMVIIVLHCLVAALVPDQVKKELLQRIRTFLAQQTDL